MGSAVELRIILIVIAVIVIAAIYIWYRTHSKDRVTIANDYDEVDLTKELDEFVTTRALKENESLPEDLRTEFSDVSKEMRDETITKRVQEAQDKRAAATRSAQQASSFDPNAKEMVVVFHVVAREPEKFSGPMIKQMMSELDLEYGEMGIFHLNVERFEKKQSIYCVANMLKPGTFDIDNMTQFSTPGLTFILQLPGPEESLKSLNIMIEHAQRLATFLNGELLDKDQSPLTNQAISHYKEQVQLFGLRASRAATA